MGPVVSRRKGETLAALAAGMRNGIPKSQQSVDKAAHSAAGGANSRAIHVASKKARNRFFITFPLLDLLEAASRFHRYDHCI